MKSKNKLFIAGGLCALLASQSAIATPQEPIEPTGSAPFTCVIQTGERGITQMAQVSDQQACQTLQQSQFTQAHRVNHKYIVEFQHPSLLSAHSTSTHAQTDSDNRAVQQQMKAVQQSFIQQASRLSSDFESYRHYTQLLNGLSFSAHPDDIEKLKSLPEVVRIEKDRLLSPALYRSTRAIKANQLWTQKDAKGLPVTGKGIRVAVLDTGINYKLTALGGCFGQGCKVAGGYDFVNDDPTPLEDEQQHYRGFGHGTHVAGIIAAKSQNLTGVAPDATLYAYKVCGPDLCSTSNIIAALERASDPDQNPATDDKVQVVNMSLGSSFGDGEDMLSSAVNKLVDKGITVVIAAGNDGPAHGLMGSPASAEKAITVAASHISNQKIANFSTRGSGRKVKTLKPEITAPGDGIRSTFVNFYSPEFTTSSLSGTSMAAPHIAGGAALMLQLMPNLTPAQLKSKLVNSASPFPSESNLAQGAGLANLLQASTDKLSLSPATGFTQYTPTDSAIWQRSFPFQLNNTGSQSEQYTIKLAKPLPKGVTAALSHTQLTLTPGQSRTLQLTLKVAREDFKTTDINAIENSIEISSESKTTQTVPIVVSLLKELKVTTVGSPTELHILSETSDLQYHFTPPNIPTSLLLPESDYTVVARFEENRTSQWVFNENTKLNTSTEVVLKYTDAVYELKIDEYLDQDGKPITLQNMEQANTLEFRLKNTRKAIQSAFHSYSTRPFSVSKVSSKFDIVWAGTLQFLGKKAPQHHSVFSFIEKPNEIAQNINIKRDAQQLAYRRYFMIDRKALSYGVTLNLSASFYSYIKLGALTGSPVHAVGFILPVPGSGVPKFKKPFKVDLYGNTSSASFAGNQNQSLIFSYIDVENRYKSISGAPFNLRGQSEYAIKLTSENYDDDRNEIHVPIKADISTIDRQHFMFSGKVEIKSNYLAINGPEFTEKDNKKWPISLLRWNMFHDSDFNSVGRFNVKYTLYCAGNVTYEIESYYLQPQNVTSCHQPKLNIVYNGDSKVSYDFSKSSATAFSKSAPTLLNAFAQQNGQRVYAANQDGAEFVVQVENPDEIKYASFHIYYGKKWEIIRFPRVGDDFIAKLPMRSKGQLASVHLTLTSKDDVTVTHTLRRLFKLGKDQKVD